MLWVLPTQQQPFAIREPNATPLDECSPREERGPGARAGQVGLLPLAVARPPGWLAGWLQVMVPFAVLSAVTRANPVSAPVALSRDTPCILLAGSAEETTNPKP